MTRALDAAIAIQRSALMEALRARLAADPRCEGLRLPDGFAYEPMGSGQAHVHHGAAWMPRANGDVVRSIESVPDAWSPDAAHVVRTATLDALEAHAHLAMRMAAQSFRPFDAPPWAVLVHPVVLAVCLGHDPDRDRMPLGTDPRDHGKVAHMRWDVDDVGNPSHPGRVGVATGECWIERGVLHASRMGVLAPIAGRDAIAALQLVSVISGHTRISAPGRVPDGALSSIPGRPLREVLGLPATGHADVDEAAGACVVSEVGETPGGMWLHFAPARCIPWGVPPTADDARAMALHPHVA